MSQSLLKLDTSPTAIFVVGTIAYASQSLLKLDTSPTVGFHPTYTFSLNVAVLTKIGYLSYNDRSTVFFMYVSQSLLKLDTSPTSVNGDLGIAVGGVAVLTKIGYLSYEENVFLHTSRIVAVLTKIGYLSYSAIMAVLGVSIKSQSLLKLDTSPTRLITEKNILYSRSPY